MFEENMENQVKKDGRYFLVALLGGESFLAFQNKKNKKSKKKPKYIHSFYQTIVSYKKNMMVI